MRRHMSKWARLAYGSCSSEQLSGLTLPSSGRAFGTPLKSNVSRQHLRIPMDTATGVVREFWRLMASNDFSSVAAVLSPTYVLEWPQTNERIRGAERFAQMNFEYPSNGPWSFQIHRIVGSETEAVSDVSVTDGVQNARRISFFTVVAGKITKQVEFWPEPYTAPPNREHLVEPIQ